MVIFVPSWGIMTGVHEGAWRGAFTNKNILGSISVLALIVFDRLRQINEGRRHVWGSAIILAIVMIIMSDSMTAYVLTFIAIVTKVILLLSKAMKKSLQIFFLILILLGGTGLLIFSAQYESIVNSLGRDPTLTGRIPLWTALISIGKNKLFGFGYQSFWVGDNYPSGEIYKIIRWHPAHGHNGYIDIFLQLGWVGFAIIVLLLIYLLIRHFSLSLHGEKNSEFWVIFLIVFLVRNVVESGLLSHNNIYTVFLLLSVLVLKNNRKINLKQDQLATKWR